MAFFLLQTAIVANDAYVTWTGGRSRACSILYLEFADEKISSTSKNLYPILHFLQIFLGWAMYYPLISIALGSVLGAWLRWFLGLKLNPIFPDIPLGTVTVNFVGGFIIGFAISYFSQSALSPNYKLFVITGFCGALTTFSTFSAEIIALLQSGKLGYACAAILIHVMGSLLFTILGMSLHQWLTAA